MSVYSEVEFVIDFDEAVKGLPVKKVEAVRLYFGIGCAPMEQACIAEIFGLSKSRIHQYIGYVLRKIRQSKARSSVLKVC